MRNHFVRFVKYFCVGGSAALINWGMFFCLLHLCEIYYLISGFCSFVVATLWNFVLAKKTIFKDSKYHIIKESFLIYFVSAIGLLIDTSALFVCVDYFNLNEMLSKILASAVAFIFNFSIRNFVIYKDVS